jgi:hypothetical protein
VPRSNTPGFKRLITELEESGCPIREGAVALFAQLLLLGRSALRHLLVHGLVHWLGRISTSAVVHGLANVLLLLSWCAMGGLPGCSPVGWLWKDGSYWLKLIDDEDQEAREEMACRARIKVSKAMGAKIRKRRKGTR